MVAVPADFPSICPLVSTVRIAGALLDRWIAPELALIVSKKEGVMVAVSWAVGLVQVLMMVNPVVPVRVTLRSVEL
jgi:hypothetical protein